MILHGKKDAIIIPPLFICILLIQSEFDIDGEFEMALKKVLQSQTKHFSVTYFCLPLGPWGPSWDVEELLSVCGLFNNSCISEARNKGHK